MHPVTVPCWRSGTASTERRRSAATKAATAKRSSTPASTVITGSPVCAARSAIERLTERSFASRSAAAKLRDTTGRSSPSSWRSSRNPRSAAVSSIAVSITSSRIRATSASLLSLRESVNRRRSSAVSGSERGFLLLRQDDGELRPVVSRNFAAADLEANDRSVSRSIAERAAQTGEPVITVDAGVDERFAVAASVAALRLRSVLAVPLRQHGTVTGCIYVAHRLRGGAFDDRAASVLGELADIAALAIENARLTERLRRSTHEVDELNRRLAADLEGRAAELVRVKAELPDRDRLRHRYERIVGRSPRW